MLSRVVEVRIPSTMKPRPTWVMYPPAAVHLLRITCPATRALDTRAKVPADIMIT